MKIYTHSQSNSTVNAKEILARSATWRLANVCKRSESKQSGKSLSSVKPPPISETGTPLWTKQMKVQRVSE